MNEDTIPEDVRRNAIAALDAYRAATGAGLLVAFEDQVGAVAFGILAERDRCAKAAELMSDGLYGKADREGIAGRDSAFAAWVVANVAASIRKSTP